MSLAAEEALTAGHFRETARRMRVPTDIVVAEWARLLEVLEDARSDGIAELVDRVQTRPRVDARGAVDPYPTRRDSVLMGFGTGGSTAGFSVSRIPPVCEW
jgi:hypothetical protein